jgi:hypothetical protein
MTYSVLRLQIVGLLLSLTICLRLRSLQPSSSTVTSFEGERRVCRLCKQDEPRSVFEVLVA